MLVWYVLTIVALLTVFQEGKLRTQGMRYCYDPFPRKPLVYIGDGIDNNGE